jgi:hypothetical protein
MRRIMTGLLVAAVVLTLTGTMLAGAQPDPAAPAQQAGDPLVRLLAAKGVLTGEEAQALAAVPAAQQRDQLTVLLLKKGIISSVDLQGVSTSNERTMELVSSSATPALKPAVLVTTSAQAQAVAPQAPPAPAVIPAIAPIRVLQVEASKPGGLVPDIKLGSKANLKLYGFLKTSVVYDTSLQQGNDFPLPGFLGDTGPNGSPEFHLKARAARVGVNFDWPDISKNVALTGKLELDFEGNFTRVNNRNISSIRSSQPSLRLAYMRLDKIIDANNSVFALFGQDWTPFGSSTLPNLIETTGFGIGFGTLYERAPQVRVGFNHKFGGSRNFSVQPEFAIALPGFGNLPPFVATQTVTVPACAATPCPSTIVNVTTPAGNLGDQLGYGERQGVDSQRPEVQGRLVFQFQLDKAKGVAPAQIILSGMQASRKEIILAAGVPTCATCPGGVNTFKTAFPRGAEVSSDRWGYTGEIQLPTRFVTVLAKYYRGTDLRWYFAGQILQEFNDLAGLTNTTTAFDIDSSAPNPVFGLRAGTPVVAPQLPVRSQGGFVNLGFPLSRIANADAKGRNAGWTLYLHYGIDQVFSRDARRFGSGTRDRGDLASGNLQWKINPFVTFGYELSYYRTGSAGTNTFRGLPARVMHDTRSEFATIFSF